VDLLLKAKVDTNHIVRHRNKNALKIASDNGLADIVFRFLSAKHPQELVARQPSPNLMNRLATHFLLTIRLREAPTFHPLFILQTEFCIKEVNKLRNNLFQILFAFRNRLPTDSAKSVLLYTGCPEWYQHRFNRDLQSMSQQVIDVLNERKHKAKALALQHKYEALAALSEATDEHPKKSRTFLCVSRSSVKRFENLAEAPSSRRTGAPEYDAFKVPRAEQSSSKRLRGG
jgi:hypothetical protein